MSTLKTISTDTLELLYEDDGFGFPIILLHGFGEDRTIWSEQVKVLAKKYRVICADLPGTGKSKMLPPASITIDTMADALKVLLDKEMIKECIVLGHSMGGYITLRFAEQFPQYLKGFGLIHSTAFADTAEKKFNRTRAITLIQEYGGQSLLRTTIPNLFGEAFKEKHPKKLAQLIEQSASFQDASLIAYYATMRDRPDRKHVLQQSAVPVLFIAGTTDIAVPLTDSLQQAHLPNKSYIHVLENVGHMGMWEATTTVNQYLLQYVEAVIG